MGVGSYFMKKKKNENHTESSREKASVDVKQLVGVLARKAHKSPKVLDMRRAAYRVPPFGSSPL